MSKCASSFTSYLSDSPGSRWPSLSYFGHDTSPSPEASALDGELPRHGPGSDLRSGTSNLSEDQSGDRTSGRRMKSVGAQHSTPPFAANPITGLRAKCEDRVNLSTFFVNLSIFFR